MQDQPILEAHGLRISFRTPSGSVHAVRGVDFSLHAGETLAIVGESGSGKSVTCKAIMGLLPGNASVEGGSILFGRQDLLRLREREFCRLRGRKIAMVFQDPLSSLNPIMRVGRQLTEVMRLSGVPASQAKARALSLLTEVGIPEPERRYRQYPFELSGGMRQRIVIAIALASDPEVLICDEPTTALDVTIQAGILDLLRRLKEERNLSMIFITHDLGVVANVADRIAVMYAGKIVEEGTAEEIFYSPAHPYTWALLSSMPDLDTRDRLEAIPGTPPNMLVPPAGDAFADRNPYALAIDFELESPFFVISETHRAATWLLDPRAPKVAVPDALQRRIERMRARRGAMQDA